MDGTPATKSLTAMARFDWADPFFLDDQLTDDERMIRDTARAYAAATAAASHRRIRP